MRATNQTRNVVLVERGYVAASLWTRLRGLLGRAPLQAGDGLLLRGEKAIHTVGMGYPIDVLFLDRSGQVVHLYHAMPPLRASPYVRRAQDILELPPGVLAKTGTALGDVITFDL
jgi:uncharacterized membrane protein (UPF0127 family)